ncbi:MULTISPECIES: hypothetical protein [Chitinophagaceae]|uniref:hypothetical protein n=1 Tax=Chitinophagaceae TaxID=563835 RepID=UPI000DEF47E9|nr:MULTISPECIES: hypothetical protein [Chitinophagaceae]RPD43801.1 hypothetical protein DRJ53_18615 [Paracnuella aquatica]
MQAKNNTYDNVLKRFHSLLMMVLLMWLTVSTPFVYEAQQDVLVSQGITDEEVPNPLTNTNEERVEAGGSNLSEYLHEPHQYQVPSNTIELTYKCHPDDLYSAFHPELLSPPPELG